MWAVRMMDGSKVIKNWIESDSIPHFSKANQQIEIVDNGFPLNDKDIVNHLRENIIFRLAIPSR